MYKVFLLFSFLVSSLFSDIYDGVSVVVKDKVITLYDVKEIMKEARVDAKVASNILIRQALEEIEVEKKHITVTSSEIYNDIKSLATQNGMSVSAFYDAIRETNNLTSSQLKEKIRKKILSQKLYTSVAMGSLNEPNDEEIQEYYELHKDKFSNILSFDVIVYESSNPQRLEEKISNPMFYAPDIKTQEQTLLYKNINPQLASLLSQTPLNSFSKIIPNANNSFISFYLKSIKKSKNIDIKSLKPQIANMILQEKREALLSDYFAKLKDNTDINIIRLP